MRSCVLLATLLALCAAAWGQGQTAVVSFSARGISGTIQFIALNENSTRILVNLQGLRGNHTWHVHTLPIDQTRDPATQCLSPWAGPHYDPFNARGSLTDAEYQMRCTPQTPLGCEAGDLAGKFGPIDGRNGIGQVNVTDTTGQLRLEGPISIIGRSVVIHDVDGSNFECGTIRSMRDIEMGATVLQATFISPVAGTVYFRQVQGEEVQIWGKLYWVNDTATTMQHNWHIHETAPGEEYRVGMCNVGPHYDPTGNGPTSRENYTIECTPQTPRMCEIGDLTGKHATINIAARPANFATYSFLFTDSFLNLTGVFAVEGRALAIHEANRGAPMIACAPLVASETITLNDYHTDYLSVSQQSPFDDTIFTSSANPPARLTILNAALTPHDICPATSSTPFDSVYSPYPVDSSITNTPDRYALGDLQSRFNSELNMANNRFNVFDMPVYGSNVTISGLTLRQGTAGSNVGRCSAFIPAISGDGVIAAKASFTGDVGGNIIFIQRYNSDGTLGNTSTQIYVDIYYTTMREMTTGHNWHVHMNPPLDNTACVDAIGGHYNPFNVSLRNLNDQNQPSINSDYSQDCSPHYPLRCESGDMSGKHGQLSIACAVPGRPSYTYVDPNLYLRGRYTIIGRSIGLHLPTGPLFACAAIQRFYVAPAYLSIQFNVGDYDSVSVVRRLTMTTTVAPGDVLVLAQEVGPPNVNGISIQCANVTMRVLGETQEAADANYAQLSPRTTVFVCSGSTPTISSASTPTISSNSTLTISSASTPTISTNSTPTISSAFTPTISSGSKMTISLLVMAASLLLALAHN